MCAGANALSYLRSSADRIPNAMAVADEDGCLTYEELYGMSRRVGTALVREGANHQAVVVVMEKSCLTLGVMMGVLQAGGHYVPVDPGIPAERLARILDVLGNPLVVAEDRKHTPACTDGLKRMVCACDLAAADADDALLRSAAAGVLETDPAYVLFTSGSTGTPKGVVISHRAIVSFINEFVGVLGIREGDRVANQAPFDFDVSTKDIYGSFAAGATLVIVPRAYFMQPVALMEYLSKQRATVLVWAVAALCIVSTYHAFQQVALPNVRVVAFSGEVMPKRHLDEWRQNLPNATFINLYGPTEITCNCLYHLLDPNRAYEDGIPLGTSFAHCEVLLVDEDGKEVVESEVAGEMIVRGPSVALGYVGASARSAKAFTQNPLHDRYPDRVYCTGDLAVRSEAGELFFRGRKDNQIKHMGHRIELEDIESTIERMDAVSRCRCAYDDKRKRLCGFYEGEATVADVQDFVVRNLPQHMRPAPLRKVEAMPLTEHGKVDRAALLESTRRRRTKKARS